MIPTLPTLAHAATPEERLAVVRQYARHLAADRKRPILIGPWRSELGFEALYWLPFLHWLAKTVPHFDQRARVVTRGGLAPLYASVACGGYDLYALRSVAQVRRENLADHQQTGVQKQYAVTPWDEAVLDEAADAMGIGRVYDLVHPSLMYWALTPFWQDQAGATYLAKLTQFLPVPRPPKPEGLPAEYVAVKFYARATFPYPEQDITQFLRRVVGVIAAQAPVVLVSSGEAYDDHLDVSMTGPGIVALPAAPPAQNLWQQAAVLAHAKVVVGTYGGMMQLALRMGVPTVSFWRDWGGTANAHLELSQRLGRAAGVPFLTGGIRELDLWTQVLSPPHVPVPMTAVPAPGPMTGVVTHAE